MLVLGQLSLLPVFVLMPHPTRSLPFRFGTILMLIVLTAGVVLAGPPFPWRPQSLGPAPYTQRQAVRPWPVAPTPAPVVTAPRPAVTGSSPPQRMTVRKPASQFLPGCGIHIAASERFLDELIRVESQEEGPVRDCILGAEVVGSQSTETQVQVKLIPDPDQARFDIVLRGTTRNQTENRTSQAVIQSEGNHRFDIAKSVQFDGKQLLTRSPAAWLYPCQRNRSAFTPASAIPILGPLVSQYALGVAEQRRPEAERITANRITQRVAPQFDKAIDSRLASLNRGLLQTLPQVLPQFGIEAPSTRVHTTDRELIASLAWDSVQTVPEYSPPAIPPDAPILHVALHADAVNDWLARLPLGGREIAVSDLARWQTELQQLLSGNIDPRSSQPVSNRAKKVPVRPASEELWLPGFGEPTIIGPILPPARGTPPSEPTLIEETQKVPTPVETDEVLPEPSPGDSTRLVLAKNNPVSIKFASGEAVITIVTAFKVDLIPQTDEHCIRIPLRSRIEGNSLVVTPGTISVDNAAVSSGAFSETVRQAIEQQVQQRIQPTTWPLERQFAREQGGPVTLRLNTLNSDNSWLSLAWTVQGTSANSQSARAR